MSFSAALAALLLAGSVPTTWWLAGIGSIFVAVFYELAVSILHSYLADMSDNEQRSRASRDSVVYGNIAQVLLYAFPL